MKRNVSPDAQPIGAKQYVEKIDVTPTWAEIVPLLLAVMESGNEKGRAEARAELMRMATIADAYVTQHRAIASDLRAKIKIIYEDEGADACLSLASNWKLSKAQILDVIRELV